MRKIRAVLRCQKGTVVVMIAAAMIGLVGMTAFVVDVGVLYANRIQLVNLVDAAVLAGAQELPVRPGTAVAQALTYAGRNGGASDAVQATVGSGNTSLTVAASRNVNLFFARVFGKQTAVVNASATAQVKAVNSISKGLVPFGVVKQDWVYGKLYTLKYGAGDGYDGNYGALALGGTGASNYEYNILFGYNGKVSVNDWITTETGDKVGPTRDAVRWRIWQDPYATYQDVSLGSPRIIVLPIIDSLAVNGRNEVLCVGFSAFFLESASTGYVTGRFLQMTVAGDYGAVKNYGLYSATLVQ